MKWASLALALALGSACSSGSSGTSSPDGGSSRGPDSGPSSGPDVEVPPPPADGAVADDGGPLSSPIQGRATFYNADGSGNCSFDPSPNDLMVAAMDAPQWNGSAVCGECVTLQGPNATITVRIVDQCPGCEMGHLDLSAQAFAMIADPSLGNVPITWWVVPCSVSGPVAYRYKEGSSQYWTAIQVRNHRLPIAKLAWQNAGAWSDAPRQDYNYFLVQNGVGTTGPVTVRITAIDGQQLVDTLPPVKPALVVNGAAQFY